MRFETRTRTNWHYEVRQGVDTRSARYSGLKVSTGETTCPSCAISLFALRIGTSMWQSVTSLSRSTRMHGARLGATTRRQQPILRTRWDELVNNQTTGSSHGESSDMNKLEDINSEHISLRRIKSYIRNLEIPAEAKVILDKLLKATVNVGGQLYSDREKGSRDRDNPCNEIPGDNVCAHFGELHQLSDRCHSPARPCACPHCRTAGDCHGCGARCIQGHYGA